MNTLECSSKGDKRFSAFYALVLCQSGFKRSVEHLYQNAKRNEDGTISGKGKQPAYLKIGSDIYPNTALTAWYNYLWLKYFEQNPELLEVLAQYDKFTDMFRGHCINCQADVMQLIHDKGIEALKSESDYTTFPHHK